MDPNADASPYAPQPLADGETLCRLATEADAFSCHRRNGLRALNYAYVTGDPEQFRFPFSEMRGLIVDQAGRITAGPFHKFWNWQEPGAAVAACPWDAGCEITAKMDDSLVYPAFHAGGELAWCTRSGPTDIAQLVVDFLENDLDDAERQEMRAVLHYTIRDTDGTTCTPLFKFCSPDNRIVVRHERASLTLLAVRRIGDGRYWPYSQVAETFEAAYADTGMRSERLRLVDTVTAGTGTREERERFVAAARRLDADHEGYVVSFPSGHRIKLKGEQYVTLHRGRDAYARETHVLKAILSGGMDDLTAILDEARAARVGEYGRTVLGRLTATSRDVAARMSAVRKSETTRKAQAISWITETATEPQLRPWGFVWLDEVNRGADDPAAAMLGKMREHAARLCTSSPQMKERVLPLLDKEPPRWNPPDRGQE